MNLVHQEQHAGEDRVGYLAELVSLCGHVLSPLSFALWSLINPDDVGRYTGCVRVCVILGLTSVDLHPQTKQPVCLFPLSDSGLSQSFIPKHQKFAERYSVSALLYIYKPQIMSLKQFTV